MSDKQQDGNSTIWKNWSGQVTCTPTSIEYPESTEAVADLVRSCREHGRTLRAVGSGHSFSPLVATNDCIVSLDGMQGLIRADKEAGEAEAWAGTKLHALGDALFEAGLAQENLGDINRQSVAGVTATGSHGTGIGFQGIANQIRSLELVDGTGTVRQIGPKSLDTLRCARISLGALGIVTRVTLDVVPSYNLTLRSDKESLDSVMKHWQDYNRQHRNFEFFWFPYSGRVQTKITDKAHEPVRKPGTFAYLTDIVVENYGFLGLSQFVRAFPAAAGSASKLLANLVFTGAKINHSHQVYATPRLIRFNEMEYSVPQEAFPDVIKEMKARLDRDRFKVHMPIKCRFSASDDTVLSSAYQRDSAYIAVHMFEGMPYRDYFGAMEEIFLRYEGRPHWGKLHSLKAEQLAPRYPEWDRFLALRAECDPDGVFLNDHLRGLFGLPE